MFGLKNDNMGNKIRKYFRKIHVHLSYFFVGIILVYAISGISMNHLRDFNPKYMISVEEIKVDGAFPRKQNYTKDEILTLLKPIEENENYMKHYYSNETTLRVFLKNNSFFSLDTGSGIAKYESLKKRPVLSQLSFLHYNPSKWWTYFSDIFAISLMLICLTGIFMNKGKRGIWGIGGIEMLIGISIPILFLLFT